MAIICISAAVASIYTAATNVVCAADYSRLEVFFLLFNSIKSGSLYLNECRSASLQTRLQKTNIISLGYTLFYIL